MWEVIHPSTNLTSIKNLLVSFFKDPRKLMKFNLGYKGGVILANIKIE